MKPKVVSLAKYMFNEGVERIALVGFSWGGWVAANILASEVTDQFVCGILAHPSINLEERMYGGSLVELFSHINRPLLMLPAHGDPYEYDSFVQLLKNRCPSSDVIDCRGFEHNILLRGRIDDRDICNADAKALNEIICYLNYHFHEVQLGDLCREAGTVTGAASGMAKQRTWREYLDQTGQYMREGVSQTGQRVRQGWEQIKQGAQQTGERMQEGWDQTKQRTQEGWDQTKQGAQQTGDRMREGSQTIMASDVSKTSSVKVNLQRVLSSNVDQQKLDSLLLDANMMIYQAYHLVNFYVIKHLDVNTDIVLNQSLYEQACRSVTTMSSAERSNPLPRLLELKALFAENFLPFISQRDLPSRDAMGHMIACIASDMVTRAHTALDTTKYLRFTKYLGIKHGLTKSQQYQWWNDICNIDYKGDNPLIKEYQIAWFHGVAPNMLNVKQADHCFTLLKMNYWILQFYESLTKEEREQKKIRLFTILPVKQSFTISHIPMDTLTIQHVLKFILKTVPPNREGRSWDAFLNFTANQCGMKRSHFGNFITTDGVSISLLKKINPKPRASRKKKRSVSEVSSNLNPLLEADNDIIQPEEAPRKKRKSDSKVPTSAQPDLFLESIISTELPASSIQVLETSAKKRNHSQIASSSTETQPTNCTGVPSRKKKQKSVSRNASEVQPLPPFTPDHVVGIDPGQRAFITACSGDNKEDFFQMTSKEYYCRAGMTYAAQMKTKLYDEMDVDDKASMLNLPTAKSASVVCLLHYYREALPNVRKWITFHLEAKLPQEIQKPTRKSLKAKKRNKKKASLQGFRGLNLHVYRKKQKTMNYICGKLTKTENTVIGFGNYSSHQSRVKGHARCPILGLQKELRKHAKKPHLISMDEYNTSKKCSFCTRDERDTSMAVRNQKRSKQEGETRKNIIYGAVLCSHPQCSTGLCGMDRDINAAWNIRFLTVKMLNGEDRPSAFRRSSQNE
jgi:hypothetical protein